MTLVREFNLYLNAGKSIPLVINANQYDQGEQWVFTLYTDSGVQYTPSSGAIVGIKSDNLGIINTATVDGQGRVVVNETQQMTAAVGKATFELLIDGQTHGTANFFVLVEPKPGDNADLSESDYSLFQEAINGTSATAIAEGVATWMDENLTPTTPVVDASLTVQGAAADAKKTGDEISELKTAINPLVEGIPQTNLFDGDFDEIGYIDASTGEDLASSNFRRTSKYYPIIGDRTLGNLYGYLNPTVDAFTVCFYDSNKSYVSFVNYNNSATKTNVLPSNAEYFRIYTRVAYEGQVTLALTPVSEYIPYEVSYHLKYGIVAEENLSAEVQAKISDASDVGQIESDLLEKKYINFFDGAFPNSGYINTDGTDATGSEWKRTDYIPIDNNESTIYFLRTAQPYLLVLFFYDSSKSVIGTFNRIFKEDVTALTTSIAIPTTASYVRMYTSVSDYSGNLMLSYEEQDSFIEYGESYYLKNGVVSENNLDDALKAKVNGKLTGKTIAFMGDSIIGNFYDSTGVCAKLAEVTGANVINCAFGGSRIAYRYGSNPQFTYWNALSGAGLADAIASGNWSAQDTAVANLTGGLDYFAQRLAEVKAVDWSAVDFIMWEYGTNDFMTEVKLDGSDLYAYNYSYRHAIETILTAYPSIRIITVTPTYRWYQSGGAFTDDSNTHLQADYAGVQTKLTDFVEMAQTVSKEYQIPCIDDYYTLGANRYTRLAYFDSTDGTHPNANGRQRIAEHIEAQLMSLV